MRSINLVPADERRGAGGAGGRSGGAAHVLLGLLAILVVLVSFHTLDKRSVDDKRAELANLETQASGTEARAAELGSFVQFAGLRAARTQTISSLATSRFDWSHALREIARVIPTRVSLTALQATVAPGVATKSSATGATSSLRAAIPVPAIELTGCTTDHDAVARMLTRMRLIDGVTRVSLQSSMKTDATQGGAGGGSGQSDACRQGNAGSPQFGLVVFFDPTIGGVPTETARSRRISATQFTPSGTTGATGPAATTGATP